MYPLAREVARQSALGCYYSGYPAWKLRDASGMPLRIHSLRTSIVYALLKHAPRSLRPSSRRLFHWQDEGFDRWAGGHLEPCDFIHGIPGQCLHTFRAARRLGIRTVLNHATGPARDWVRIMEPEYARVGLRLTDHCAYDDAYFAREDEEYALSDWHCTASFLVREQLIARGIEARRILIAPYGADPGIFFTDDSPPPQDFRIIFAGQICLRKGVRTLLDALTLTGHEEWNVDFYGGMQSECARDLDGYHGATPLRFHGAVSQTALGEALRSGSVLVLPSLEEGFGLVVPQALNCGLPTLVSDRVGGKDLVRHRENGSIVPAANAEALAAELEWWSQNPRRIHERHGWEAPARILIDASQPLLS
jgi:glycosyltransferase involved in cell wall biosynthesis